MTKVYQVRLKYEIEGVYTQLIEAECLKEAETIAQTLVPYLSYASRGDIKIEVQETSVKPNREAYPLLNILPRDEWLRTD